ASIPKLQVSEWVPVPQHVELTLRYDDLAVREANGIKEYVEVYRGSVITIRVDELLNGVDEAGTRPTAAARQGKTQEAVRVVFSYSRWDQELKDQLATHLKLMERQGLISSWSDTDIRPGDDWEGAIDESFQRAGLILLLVIADFNASIYCESETRVALKR